MFIYASGNRQATWLFPNIEPSFAQDKAMCKETAALVDVVHNVVCLEDVRQDAVQTVQSRIPSADKGPNLEDALLHL